MLHQNHNGFKTQFHINSIKIWLVFEKTLRVQQFYQDDDPLKFAKRFIKAYNGFNTNLQINSIKIWLEDIANTTVSAG